MKTQLEHVSPVKKKVSVELPVERVVEALEAAYKKIQKDASIKGFRKGHVPKNLLEQYFKDDAEKEAISELINKTWIEAVEKEGVKFISEPEVTVGPFQKDAPFSYTAVVEIRPEVAITDYHDLSLEKHEVRIEDEEVEKRLALLQQGLTQVEPANDDAVLEKGMVAYVDFNGTVDGKPFKGGAATNFYVDIGSGGLLSQFEDGIIGMKKGESRKIEFDYPADYFNKELAGRHGVFDIAVREIKIKRVPALNDEFAKDVGDFKNLSEVRADIKKKLEQEADHAAKEALGGQA